jgi:hypothetical protein
VNPPLIDGLNRLLIDIDPDDLQVMAGQNRRKRQADIAQTEDANSLRHDVTY